MSPFVTACHYLSTPVIPRLLHLLQIFTTCHCLALYSLLAVRAYRYISLPASTSHYLSISVNITTCCCLLLLFMTFHYTCHHLPQPTSVYPALIMSNYSNTRLWNNKGGERWVCLYQLPGPAHSLWPPVYPWTELYRWIDRVFHRKSCSTDW